MIWKFYEKDKWLAAMMIFGMAGCGGGADNGGTDGTIDSSASEVVDAMDNADFIGDCICMTAVTRKKSTAIWWIM